MVLSFIITSVFLLFLPNEVSIHYRLDGNVDNIGNKYIFLLIPVAICSISILMEYIIAKLKRKMSNESSDKGI